MKIITEAQVEAHLSTPDCIDAMRRAMIAVSKGETHLPIRQFMPVSGAPGKMAIMPGVVGGPQDAPWCFGIKLVCKYEREPDSPYGTHVGMVLVFDAEKGLPLAMIEGSSLTAIRTAAASAMATDLLARKDASKLLVLGCGEQALRHIRSMRAVRNIDSVSVWGRNKERSIAFAKSVGEQENIMIEVIDNLQEAAGAADLICTTTSAKEPILKGEWLSHGVHVNLVGSAIPTTAEADDACVSRSRFFVDYRPAAMAAAGELLNAIKSGAVAETHIAAEIGEVAMNSASGRTSEDDITVYKSLGVSAQDLAAAHILYEKASAEGFGLDVNMMDAAG